MRYLTLFLEAENVHLIKDVGMIPYTLYKEYGYQSSLACYHNGEYPYADLELKGLNLVFVRRIFGNPFLDALLFLMLNARKYDILQVYHLSFQSMFWLFMFKAIRPLSRTYLKLDANERVLNYPTKGLKGMINKYLFRKIDLVSVETAALKSPLEHIWGRAIALIPNGYFATQNDFIQYKDKSNIILTVGRIGATEKRTELLLEAFARFSDTFTDWTLTLVGPIEAHFHSYLKMFFEQQPQLETRVKIMGQINDRAALAEQYKLAKIFCLSSSVEGFPISLIEASSFGCYVVTSNITAANDITQNAHYGRIFPIESNAHQLAEVFSSLASNEEIIQSNCNNAQQFAHDNYKWEKIVAKIKQLIV